MDGGNLVLFVVYGGAPALLVGAIVALYVYRGREHRYGMTRFREVCKERGLTQGPEMWETTIYGVRVGARCVRYNYLRDGNVNRNYYRWDNSYLAVVTPPLQVDLDAFARAQPNLAAPNGYVAHPSMWQRQGRPPRATLAPDPYGATLHVHAAHPTRAVALLSHPDVTELLREAIAHCKDVRITDTTVELLDKPYESDMATFDHRLRLAAGIAARLTAANR